MRILIATGIYPPKTGGTGHYASQLKAALESLGHTVFVRTYTIEHHLPTGIRHAVYFLKSILGFIRADITITLDTFSVGLPVALLRKIFGGHVILRTGGDFLWEQYVERTGEKILFSEFYSAERNFTQKEKMVFTLTRWALKQMDKIVFNTTYQRDIWVPVYIVDSTKVSVIENNYEPVSVVETPSPDAEKNFVCIVRDLKWKNTDTLERAFKKAQEKFPRISLTLRFNRPHDEVIEALKNCYAAVLVSLGDIGPNFILEALSFGKPVILTRENGITNRIGNAAFLVDPLNEDEIANAFLTLADETHYREYALRVRALSFIHSYKDIAHEFLALCPH
ncbi:MAG: glycosyltransferase family 4 protein [Patescibacteria group bacterium]